MLTPDSVVPCLQLNINSPEYFSFCIIILELKTNVYFYIVHVVNK